MGKTESTIVSIDSSLITLEVIDSSLITLEVIDTLMKKMIRV
jgi:hypothetical protein